MKMTKYKVWYATMMNIADEDWGEGSYDLEEAKAMCANRPDGFIAVIEEGETPICIKEIGKLPGTNSRPDMRISEYRFYAKDIENTIYVVDTYNNTYTSIDISDTFNDEDSVLYTTALFAHDGRLYDFLEDGNRPSSELDTSDMNDVTELVLTELHMIKFY